MRPEIRDITSEDLSRSAEVIRESFATVAAEMGLNESNCPAHPSFISVGRLEELRARGLRFFGLFLDGKEVGFVAVEQAEEGLCYIEKLAIIPPCRHRGLGRQLLGFASDGARRWGGRRVSVAIIDEHGVLKDWYRDLGFVETGTRRFEHLPFTVCFMEKRLSE
jgi:diamine N-acetyltransferase